MTYPYILTITVLIKNHVFKYLKNYECKLNFYNTYIYVEYIEYILFIDEILLDSCFEYEQLI